MANGREEDDPIIEEIDVYLAKSLAEKLYLFQYPVRPSAMTYDHVDHVAARIKPKQQKVELEMAIDTMSPNYCRSKGEQMALNVDGGTASSGTATAVYSQRMMDKQTLCSVQATTNTSRYAAAVFRKGELHVAPLHGILQMRPDFSYLDRADSNRTTQGERDSSRGDETADEEEGEAKAVTVRLSRPETEWAQQRRVRSYEHLQKSQAEEPWAPARYHGVRDGRSQHERRYLFCQAMGQDTTTEMVQTPKEYLAVLMPPVAKKAM